VWPTFVPAALRTTARAKPSGLFENSLRADGVTHQPNLP
jgi:hypothetical protein